MVRQALLAGLLTLGQSATAAPLGERWTATSRTADAFTGDVTLETSRMIFSKGGALPIEQTKNVMLDDGMGRKVPASLYRVTRPSDPAGLCDRRPVTYLAIWHVRPIMPSSPEGRAFAAFSTTAEPGPTVKGSCGTFFYEMQR